MLGAPGERWTRPAACLMMTRPDRRITSLRKRGRLWVTTCPNIGIDSQSGQRHVHRSGVARRWRIYGMHWKGPTPSRPFRTRNADLLGNRVRCRAPPMVLRYLLTPDEIPSDVRPRGQAYRCIPEGVGHDGRRLELASRSAHASSD